MSYPALVARGFGEEEVEEQEEAAEEEEEKVPMVVVAEEQHGVSRFIEREFEPRLNVYEYNFIRRFCTFSLLPSPFSRFSGELSAPIYPLNSRSCS